MTSPEYLRIKALIESNLTFYLPPRNVHNKVLIDSMSYSLEAGGKRLRPVLLIATNNIFFNNEENALPFACAVEYIHTYSLIHDDLPGIDNDELRRGKPTNHKVFGEGMAIIAGDGLLNTAYEIMANELASKQECIDVIDYNIKNAMICAFKEIAFGAGINGMVVGQAADIQIGTGAKKEDLDFIHLNKTGALIVASVKAGALLGGASQEEFEKLSNYAKYLGLAFQIKDDLLDIHGNQETLGKTIGSDARLNKKTYPGVYGEKESIEILSDYHKKALYYLESFGEKAAVLVDITKELEFRLE
ncbi:MAG: polyprenyl synthetase family protein [Eubacteriales bacterium]